MSDPLLPYYHQELVFFRTQAADFARRHPQAAKQLGIGPHGTTDDPHVLRLIEAFAYLNSRIRHKLDDDLPEITDSLLGVLYPHYQRPVPSLAIVQFNMDPSQGEPSTGYALPRGLELETIDRVDGETCRFRTCYPLTMWPIAVEAAKLSGPPFDALPQPKRPGGDQPPPPRSVLRLSLRFAAPDVGFGQVRLERLRFYLDGQDQQTYALYEQLFNDTFELVLAAPDGSVDPVVLPTRSIEAVGFERDEALLPDDARSFTGYRLLTEFFALPQKFLFFDLAGLTPERLAGFGERLDVYFFLRRNVNELVHHVRAEMFRLGCTPAINLFTKPADPIGLTHAEPEYRVVPDRRRPQALEVYSIDEVKATSPRDEKAVYLPLYSFKHGFERERQTAYWHAVRRPAAGNAPAGRPGGETLEGTEVFLSLVDLGLRTSAPADWTLSVNTTCLNRDLPKRLHRPRFQLLAAGPPVSEITCRLGPTPPLRPELKQGAMWRLVSHLTLNQLSIVEGDESAAALREILSLYDAPESDATRPLIEGVRSVRGERSVRRVGGGEGGLCRGTKVRLHLDEARFFPGIAYLFSAVLSRFFGLYCTLNSFTELVVTTEGRKQRGEGELAAWPPRAGEHPLC